MRKIKRLPRVFTALLAAVLAFAGITGVSFLTVGLAAGVGTAAAQTTFPGFNPYGTPVNGCGNPILEYDSNGWSTDTAGATASRGIPGDHVVANRDFNVRTTNAGTARTIMPNRNVVAGQTWQFAADVRTDGDAASSKIQVDWFNGSGGYVNTQTGADVAIPGTRPYARVGATFTVPASITSVHVLVVTSQLNANSGFATTMCTYTPAAVAPPTTTPAPTTAPTTVPPTTVPPTTAPPTTVPTTVPPTVTFTGTVDPVPPTTDPMTTPPVTTVPPPPPPGTVLFNGDFETGDFSQWPLCQTHTYNGACSGMPAGDYALTAEHPGFQGDTAGRFEVHDGDAPFCCGERAQLVAPANETEGKDLWYSWDVKVDSTFPTSSSWQVLMQWHSDVDGSPPLNFLAEGSNLVLETRPRPNSPYTGITNVWTTPLDKGNWHAYQVHVKWSSNTTTGFVELWKDGVRQTFTATPPDNSNGVCAGTQTCHISNIYPGDSGNRPMVTYYRDGGINGTGVVHHDGFRVATTQAGLG